LTLSSFVKVFKTCLIADEVIIYFKDILINRVDIELLST
jgi:hypothetical protein